MASATVRISLEAQEVVRKLSAQTGRKMQDILDEAVELYRRQLFLEKANAAFATLRRFGWRIQTLCAATNRRLGGPVS